MPSVCNFLHCCSSPFSLFASLILTLLRHLWTPFRRSCPSLIYLHFPFHSLVPIYTARNAARPRVQLASSSSSAISASPSPFLFSFRFNVLAFRFQCYVSSTYPISFPFNLFLSIPNFLVTLRFRYLPSSPNSFIPPPRLWNLSLSNFRQAFHRAHSSLIYVSNYNNRFYRCLSRTFFFFFFISSLSSLVCNCSGPRVLQFFHPVNLLSSHFRRYWIFHRAHSGFLIFLLLGHGVSISCCFTSVFSISSSVCSRWNEEINA